MSSSKVSKYIQNFNRVRWFGTSGLESKPHEDMEGFNIAYDENAIDVFLYV